MTCADQVCVSYVDPEWEGPDGGPLDGGVRHGGSGPPWTTPRFVQRLIALLEKKPFVVPGSARVVEALHAKPARPHPGPTTSCEKQQILNRVELSFIDAAEAKRRTVIYYLNEDCEVRFSFSVSFSVSKRFENRFLGVY